MFRLKIVFILLSFIQLSGYGQHLKQVDSLMKSGNFYFAKNRYKLLLDKSLLKSGECSNTSLKLVSRLANAYINIGKVDSALFISLKFRNCGLRLSNTLGVIYDIKGKPDSAKHYYKLALLLPDSLVSRSTINNNLGALSYTVKSYKESLLYFKKAFRLYLDNNRKSRTATNIAKSYNRLGKLDSAIYYYNLALTLNFDTKTETYLNPFSALESLISKTEILPDLQTILKADSLTKIIQKRITRRSDKLRLTRQLNRVINVALPLLESKYAQTQKKKYLNLLFYFSERSKSNILLDEIASYNQGKGIIRLVTLDVVQNRLKDNQAVITYFRSKKQLYGLGVSKGLIVFQKLGNFTVLLDSMEYFQGHSQSIDPRPFLKEAPRLYKLLVKPFAKTLEGATHLLLIPTAEMMGTPFEAFMKTSPLPNGVDKAEPHEIGEALKNARYLMKDFFVSYHLSATLAFKERKRGKNYPLDFTALAHSKFASKEVTPLKYSAREAQAASSYFTPSKRQVLIDSAAHTSVLKGFRSKILHISTHGHYKFGGKLLSGLLLRTAGGAQDTLFADEVYNLGLRVELAVLSGCYSGQGRIESVEGVLGFNRALVYNNVPYIIFSSWQAYEEPSLDFFKLFYKFLSTGKHTYIEALTLTKRAIVSSPTYPAFWAGFMIIGKIN